MPATSNAHLQFLCVVLQHHASEEQRHKFPRHGELQRAEVVLGVRLLVVLTHAYPVVPGELADALVVVSGLVGSGCLWI